MSAWINSLDAWVANLLFGWVFVGLFVLAFATLFWLAPAVERYQDAVRPMQRRTAARRVLVALVGVPLLTLLWPVVFPVYLGSCLWDVLMDAYGKKLGDG